MNIINKYVKSKDKQLILNILYYLDKYKTKNVNKYWKTTYYEIHKIATKIVNAITEYDNMERCSKRRIKYDFNLLLEYLRQYYAWRRKWSTTDKQTDSYAEILKSLQTSISEKKWFSECEITHKDFIKSSIRNKRKTFDDVFRDIFIIESKWLNSIIDTKQDNEEKGIFIFKSKLITLVSSTIMYEKKGKDINIKYWIPGKGEGIYSRWGDDYKNIKDT